MILSTPERHIALQCQHGNVIPEVRRGSEARVFVEPDHPPHHLPRLKLPPPVVLPQPHT